MLEYDNSAFYYFSITLLVIYLIPSTWYAVAEFVRAFLGSGEVGAQPRTSTEELKAKKLKSNSTGWGRLKKPAYLINLVLTILGWVIFLYLISLVKNDGEVNTFDPFTILGIEQGSSASDIKKAYRSLSLKYHPDKNPGNKKAEEIFMKVAKAYEALTDEVAKENYEKYGNPDGKQALEVSIGLPRLLLDNPKVVLILYLIAMVIVIPVAVGLWYANSKQYGENNVKNRTYQIIYSLLQESNRMKHMPEILAASDECQTINSKPDPTNKTAIAQLYGKLKNDKLMVKPRCEAEVVLHGNLLLHAHMLKLRSMLNESLCKDLDAMLSISPEIIDGIIAIAYHRKWVETTLAAIRFSQCVIQGLWYTSDPYEQLPHLSESVIQQIKSSKKFITFVDFLRAPNEDKALVGSLTSNQLGDLYRACKLFTVLQVQTRLFVEEDDEEDLEAGIESSREPEKIFEKDLVTIRTIITRENLNKDEKLPPVYAPSFPKTVFEGWWLILLERPKGSQGKGKGVPPEPIIHNIEKVTETGRVFKFDLKFMAPDEAGSYQYELHILCDSYIGLDQVIPITFTVSPESELPEYQPHPEDLELDNEPTLFEQMMAANADDDSSDDEEDKSAATGDKKSVEPINRQAKSAIYESDDDEED